MSEVRCVARVSEPDDVSVTVAITMSAGTWKSFLLRLNEQDWPGFPVGRAVREALEKFTHEHEGTSEYVRG